jgi:hypothetical protein
MYSAKNLETGEILTMTEEQVRAEITDVYQHDMPTTMEYTDEEIAKQVATSNLDDHFVDDVFEGNNYEITRTKYPKGTAFPEIPHKPHCLR